MTNNWEKVVKGLECCREMDNPPGWIVGGCTDCPYKPLKGKEGCAKKLKEDARALLKAPQEPIETRLHLCESCTKEYPECDATADGIEFGNGTGNDNIIGCTAYTNRWKTQEPRLITNADFVNKELVDSAESMPAWIEYRHGEEWDEYNDGNDDGWSVVYQFNFESEFYRCWTARPTDEQREATPWQ